MLVAAALMLCGCQAGGKAGPSKCEGCEQMVFTTDTMLECPGCDHDVKAGDMVACCPRCGAKTPVADMPVTCDKCGKKVIAVDKMVCKECRAKLTMADLKCPKCAK
jgi:hypothetical protein